MKVFALVVLVLGSASALGSGPYLPSGWRPSGPAFHLPTERETQKPIPLKDVQIEEETSGADSLREYGPPKGAVVEISQDITQQALPSPVTDQAFVIIEAKFNEDANAAAEGEKLVAVEESTTATQGSTVEVTSESETIIKGRNIEVETQTESDLQEAYTEGTTEDSVLETSTEEEKTNEEVSHKEVEAVVEQQETENANSNIATAIEANAEEQTVGEVKIDEGVKNIAEALINLENEINAQQIQTIQEVTEVRTIQENLGSLQQAPEGFLEYAPPGFTEYGPPKEALRTSAVVEDKPAEAAWETNETRRRRFSPKFKATQRKH